MITIQIFVAFLFLFGLGAGATLLLVIEGASGHRWLGTLSPPLQVLAKLAPAGGVAALMAWAFAGPLYPWWEEPRLAGYLGPTWGTARLAAVVALVSLWGWTAGLSRAWATLGAIVLTLAITLSCVDWTLALDHHMKSAIFGLIFLSGWVVSAAAAAVVAGLPAWSRADRQRWGSFLLVLLVVWLYFELMQYIVFWGGDLPWEARWWSTRSTGPWMPVYLAVLALHVILPFALLSYHYARQTPSVLSLAALSVLLGRALEMALWVGPDVPVGGDHSGLAVLVAVAAFGLAWVGAWALRDREVADGR